MKAAYCTKYGPPEVIEVREVPKPSPSPNQILVKIIASSVNSGDVRVRGLQAEGWMKFVMRMLIGWSKPRKPILGVTFAGIVEAVGSKISKFEPGDNVYGLTAFKFGCHAEYTIIAEDNMVMKMPINASFQDAAAILFGGQTAVSFLHKMHIQTKPKAKILILGATGAVGSSSIQIAKYYGAEVTAVCSSLGRELCDALGADHVIAYDQEDIYHSSNRYDLILDAVGKYSKKKCKHLLTNDGIYKTIGGMEYASESIDQLKLLTKIYEEGKLKPVIDKVFNIDQIVEAHRYVDTGRKKGNVILSFNHL
jgi:NADPH:quinone reductase-like Zn-dependent oxidoreductase